MKGNFFETMREFTNEKGLLHEQSIFSMFKLTGNDICYKCPNHPSNGGSGMCNCTLPYINKIT